MRYEQDDRLERTKGPVSRKSSASTQRKRTAYDPDRPRKPVSDAGRSRRPDSDYATPRRPATGSTQTRKAAPRSAAHGEARRSAPPRRNDGARARRAPDYDREFRAPARKKTARRNRRAGKGGMTLLWVLAAMVAAFAISVYLHNNVFEVVRMSGDSMYSSINKGDIVIVNKLDKGNISRGDIVAISLPGENSFIIRRVVGLPGETISIEEGKTHIDGNAISERYVLLETYDTFEGMTLPKGKYYVLCDNRTDLTDSRMNSIAMVDSSQIGGQATYRIWPLNQMGVIQ